MTKNTIKNNEDLVKNLMTFSPYGAMGQIFVVEAIRSYAEQLANKPAPRDDLSAMVSPVLWHAIATDVHARCQAFYK